MKLYSDQLLSKVTALPLLGARIGFYYAGSDVLAPIYETADAATRVANPFIARLGAFGVFVPDGRYDIAIDVLGRRTVLPAIDIFDLVELERRLGFVESDDAPVPKTFKFFGVDPFYGLSQQSKMERMFQDASAAGITLIADPDAKYRHDGLLIVNNQQVDGRGCSFISLSEVNTAIRLTGSGASLRNITTLGAGDTRTSSDATDAGIYVTASDFVLENVTVGRAAPGLGHAAAGILFYGAKRGIIRDIMSSYSKADCIHCTGGSEDLTFYSPRAVGGGDDGFAVVSYINQGLLCKRIKTHDLLVRDNFARGVAIVGGEDISHDRPRIYRSAASAVLVQSEQSYEAYGVSKWSIRDLYAEGCVTGIGQDNGFTQPAILIAGRSGTAPLSDGKTASLGISDGFIEGRVVGLGAAGAFALSSNSGFVARQGYDLVLKDITGPNAIRNACSIGGSDPYGRIFVDGCKGIPFLLGEALLGDVAFSKLGATNTHLTDNSLPAMIHGAAANLWNSFYADFLEFRDEDGLPVSNVVLDKFQWRKFVLNGAEIPHP